MSYSGYFITSELRNKMDDFSLDDFLLWDVNGKPKSVSTSDSTNTDNSYLDDSHFTEHEIYLASLTDPGDAR